MSGQLCVSIRSMHFAGFQLFLFCNRRSTSHMPITNAGTGAGIRAVCGASKIPMAARSLPSSMCGTPCALSVHTVLPDRGADRCLSPVAGGNALRSAGGTGVSGDVWLRPGRLRGTQQRCAHAPGGAFHHHPIRRAMVSMTSLLVTKGSRSYDPYTISTVKPARSSRCSSS